VARDARIVCSLSLLYSWVTLVTWRGETGSGSADRLNVKVESKKWSGTTCQTRHDVSVYILHPDIPPIARGHDGTRGEGRGRRRVVATDDQEQGREGEGTRKGI